ncbi:MAG: M23 family metallopeptidase [Nocardioides sp.]|uniref:M23 family metallopeptidase n=1 Tax=Nocardioides sp. TaxID=35761 RepID=UPI003F0DD8E8
MTRRTHVRTTHRPWLAPVAALLVVGSLLVTGPAVASDKERSDSSDPMRVSERHNSTAVARATARKTVLPGLQVPFPCGQSWVGSTRSSHSPSYYSVDFNRPNDEGSPVVASASGRVTTAQATPKGGYGRWIVLDHGGSVSTLYAHLKKVLVVPGQYVEQGSVIGVLGSSGNSTGPHLHYEQKLGRTVVAPAFGGVAFRWGSIASANCLDVPLAGDLDGDGVDQVGVYRRNATGSFAFLTAAGEQAVTFGSSVEEPFLADVDGDGVDDLGVRNPRTRVFRTRTAAATARTTFGLRLDRPISGDWDGSGVDRLGVHRPGTGTFRLRQADGTVRAVKLGTAADLPVTGDFDGDGIDDVGVYDTTTGAFTLRTVDAAGTVSTRTVAAGAPGDLPVVGDWNGDGIDDVGTWTPSTATFTQLVPRAPGAARTRLVTTVFGRAR